MYASIIIPSKNRPALLKQVIRSIRKHTHAVKDCEIIVVDTGDGEDGRWAARSDCNVLNMPGGTFAQANNAAAKVAKNDALWLLNNDVILTGNCLAEWAAVLSNNDDDIILGARLLYPNGLIQHAGIGFDNDGSPFHLWHNGPAEHPEAMKPRYLPAVTFACSLISRSIWDKLGGLDERYINAYEDVDFCLRARERGCLVHYVPEATAIHFAGQTSGRFDHNAESWQHFQNVWLRDGRLYYALGSWPFSVERKGQ